MKPNSPLLTTRRHFLKTSSAAALGGALVSPLGFPAIASGAPTSEKLKIGFIGCGGRGTGAAAQALAADSNVELYAMGDVFADKIKGSLESINKQHAEKVNVTPERQFIGLDAYKKVLDCGVDLVILTTPPGFRPLHIKAAVDAGKHIFCEKPMAVDAPGARSVLASAAEAKKKNLALGSGFLSRYTYARREAVKRIHDGIIGDIRASYTNYFTSVLSSKYTGERKPGWTDLEWELRNWYNFVWLSGDHLVEQCVHNVDRLAWVMKDVPPLKCTAVGGRQFERFGNIFDHFEVNYEYAGGARAFVACRQQDRCHNETADYILGSKGQCVGARRGGPEITGETEWRYTGPEQNAYQTEHDELFASIRAGKPINDGTWMVHSTMLAIMGRMAAYTGQEITWDQAMNSQESLMPPDLDWNMKLDVPPVAMPGKTKFV